MRHLYPQRSDVERSNLKRSDLERSDLDEGRHSIRGKAKQESRKATPNPLLCNILRASPLLPIFCGDLPRSEGANSRRIRNVAAFAKKNMRHPSPSLWTTCTSSLLTLPDIHDQPAAILWFMRNGGLPVRRISLPPIAHD